MKTARATCSTKLKETKEDGAHAARPDDGVLQQQPGQTRAATRARTCRSLLAGGGFKHGQHLAFDPAKGPPLRNLYVSMLQRLGLEADKFGTSTGTLTGLDVVG